MKKILLFTVFVTVFISTTIAQSVLSVPTCPTFKDAGFLNYQTSGGKCYVDFTITFLNDQPGTDKSAKVTIYYKSSGSKLKEQIFNFNNSTTTKKIAGIQYECSKKSQLWYKIDLYTKEDACGNICNTSYLPIVLTNFSAKKVADGNQLNWTLEKEVVQSGEFIAVEKSTDVKSWKEIAIIFTDNQTANYSFTDKANTVEKTFYRLALNNNTSKTYSAIVTVYSVETGSKILVTQGQIQFTQLNGSEVIITTMTGQIVKRFKVAGDYTTKNISEFNLNSGMYIVTAKKNDAQISAKFVK